MTDTLHSTSGSRSPSPRRASPRVQRAAQASSARKQVTGHTTAITNRSGPHLDIDIDMNSKRPNPDTNFASTNGNTTDNGSRVGASQQSAPTGTPATRTSSRKSHRHTHVHVVNSARHFNPRSILSMRRQSESKLKPETTDPGDDDDAKPRAHANRAPPRKELPSIPTRHFLRNKRPLSTALSGLLRTPPPPSMVSLARGILKSANRTGKFNTNNNNSDAGRRVQPHQDHPQRPSPIHNEKHQLGSERRKHIATLHARTNAARTRWANAIGLLNPKPLREYKRGDLVRCKVPGGGDALYPGVVVWAHGDGTYDIRCDAGRLPSVWGGKLRPRSVGSDEKQRGFTKSNAPNKALPQRASTSTFSTAADATTTRTSTSTTSSDAASTGKLPVPPASSRPVLTWTGSKKATVPRSEFNALRSLSNKLGYDFSQFRRFLAAETEPGVSSGQRSTEEQNATSNAMHLRQRPATSPPRHRNRS